MYINARNVALQLSAASRYTNYATVKNPVVSGTDFADTLGGIANAVLSGGRGDDQYALWDPTARVVERAGEGVDTVRVLFGGGYTLADNVENLVLESQWAWWGNGNAQNNILFAGVAGATLDGKGGDDVLVGGSGADIFKVTAGEGSDAIVGFQAGWDKVLLSGYGIASFADLKAAATQAGADVRIGFANGESLVLRDTALSSLSGADFGFSSIGGTVPAGMKVMNGATNAWNTNGVYLLNMAWNAGGLRYGTDYQIESIFNAADTSKNATFNWSFPSSTDLNFSIKAYPSLMFGVSPYGDTKNVADTAHTFPIKLSDLVAMSAVFDTSITGSKSGFNVAYDLWFTNTPNGGPSTVTNEVMIWTHKGSFEAYGKLLGTFDAGGVTGKIYNSGTYTAIVTDKDMPAGTIDLAAVFKALEKMGILSSSSYLASVQLGSEVSTGAGSLTINNFALSVETSDGSGGTILKQASGAGTTVIHKAPIVLPTLAPIAAAKLVAEKADSPLDKLLAAGAQKTLDADGLLAGAKQVNKLSATATETLRYDASGTFVGRDLVEKSANYTTVSHYGSDRKMTGAEMVFVNTGSTVTKQYDKWWNYTGYDIETKNSAGAVVVRHYDAKDKLLSTDATRLVDGTTVKEWWDADGRSGVVTTKLDGAGNGKVERLDGAWKLQGYDEHANDGGVATVRHYDGKGVLLGGEETFVDANGVKVQQNHDKAWVLTDAIYTGTSANDSIHLTISPSAVHGGAGSDEIWSGIGADAFHFDTAIGTDVDTIHDFSVKEDSIYLSTAIFGKLPVAGGMLASSGFAIDAARDANTRIIYDSKTGGLFYDSDGTGSKAAVMFAQLDPGLQINAGHFHLI